MTVFARDGIRLELSRYPDVEGLRCAWICDSIGLILGFGKGATCELAFEDAASNWANGHNARPGIDRWCEVARIWTHWTKAQAGDCPIAFAF